MSVADPKPNENPAGNEPAANGDKGKEGHSAEYVARLKREAADARVEADKAAKERDELAKFKTDREREDLVRDKKFQDLAESERKRADEAHAKASERISAYEKRVIKTEARVALQAAGILDADDVALVDLSSVKIDDNGDPVGLDEVVEKFKAAKPAKFKTTEAAAKPNEKPVNRGGKPVGQSQETPLEKDALTMTDDEYRALRLKVNPSARI